MSGLQAWLSTHQKQAMAGGAGVVAAYALYRKHKAAATPAAPVVAGASSSTPVAGLSGDPATQMTDIQNAVQDQLNGFNDYLQGIKQGPAGPAGAPGAPAPAPTKATPAPVHLPPRKAPTPPPRKPATPPHLPPRKAPLSPPKVYTIPAGGTLYGAAQHIYGTQSPTPGQVGQLAQRNGIKLYQRNGTTMADVFKGQRITY